MIRREVTYKSLFYYIAAVYFFVWVIFASVIACNRLQTLMYDSFSGKAVLFSAFLMPALVLYVLMKRQGDIHTPKEFLCRMFSEKEHTRIALVTFAFCLGQFLMSALSGNFQRGHVRTAFLYAVPALLLEGFQETGFRGFLEETLDGEIPFALSTVLIGTMWGLLYCPLWLVQGAPWMECSFLFFLLNCVFQSIVLGALYLITRSVSACVVFRTFWVMLSCVFDGLMFDNGAYTIFSVAEMVLIFVLMACIRRRKKRNCARVVS